MADTWGLFTWVDVALPDTKAGSAFYGHLMGWEGVEDSGYTIFTRDGKPVAGMGALTQEQVAGGERPAWSSYALTDDVERDAVRVEELGGKVTVPPAGLPGSGSRAFFTDPTGAHMGLWQPDGFGGGEVFNEPGYLCWNELMTDDLNAAHAFYQGLFPMWSFHEQELDSGYRYLTVKIGERDNAGLFDVGALGEHARNADGDLSAGWRVYFAVENMDDAVARLEDAGGSLLGKIQKSSFGPIASVRDTQGAGFLIIDMT
jgi:predicted enzyme related to lactoylglutathione lyase